MRGNMKIRDSVFGSRSERELYSSLESRWANMFNLYPSLPFTSIIDIGGAKVRDGEKQYLFKTSVDFTLCEKETDKPIMSIEFDGLGHGYSHEGKYVQVTQSEDSFRKLKFDLKLRLAQRVSYPYIVISFDEADPFTEDLELTIVDGLIGRVLARKRFDELMKERRSELEGPESEDFARMKQMYEEFSKEEYTYDDYVQNWVTGLEVEAELESDPIASQATILEGELVKKGIFTGMTSEYLEDPPAPALRDSSDVETLKKRIEALQSPSTKIGCQVSLKVKGLSKEVRSRIFVRNFGLGISLSLAQNIATLLAAKKALVSWLCLSEGKTESS
jgi:phage anti-repressor protein